MARLWVSPESRFTPGFAGQSAMGSGTRGLNGSKLPGVFMNPPPTNFRSVLHLSGLSGHSYRPALEAFAQAALPAQKAWPSSLLYSLCDKLLFVLSYPLESCL